MELDKWDQEFDVVVVGYGCAGAVAATTAHDSGARVLLLEKAENPGGILGMTTGSVLYVEEDSQAGLDYFSRLSDGRIDEDIIRAFADGLTQNLIFIQKLAKIDDAEMENWRFIGVYPFEGTKKLRDFKVARVPGFTGFPWLKKVPQARLGGQNLIKVLKDNVEARGIPAMFSTAAKRLVTDNDRAVVGVIAGSPGKEIAIKARRAVILASGGFEHSDWLKTHVFEGKPVYSCAPLTNTGDGILMAQEVGAALWHMWHVHGSYGFKFPESPRAMTHSFGGPRDPKRKVPWIVVDKMGRRYMNEVPPIPFDTPFHNMQSVNPDLPGYPYIPSFMIFDEEGRKMGPVGRSYETEWSADNSEEIRKGWIIAGDTIRDLALRLKALPENEGRMGAERLEETISQWNRQVEAGKDVFGRLPPSMMTIKTPPFYGALLWPVINNTHGGPVHDARHQVLNAFREPIPRLYRAGELGAHFSHLYQPGASLAECLSSGRIAGSNAAAEEPWC